MEHHMAFEFPIVKSVVEYFDMPRDKALAFYNFMRKQECRELFPVSLAIAMFEKNNYCKITQLKEAADICIEEMTTILYQDAEQYRVAV